MFSRACSWNGNYGGSTSTQSSALTWGCTSIPAELYFLNTLHRLYWFSCAGSLEGNEQSCLKSDFQSDTQVSKIYLWWEKKVFVQKKKKNMWQRQYQQSPDSIVAVSFLPTQDTQTNRIKSSDLLNVLSSLLQNHFYLFGPRWLLWLSLLFVDPPAWSQAYRAHWLLLLSLQFTFLRTNSINKNIRPQ